MASMNWDPTEQGAKYLRYSTTDAVSENTRGNVWRTDFEQKFGASDLSDELWALVAHYWISGIVPDDEIPETVDRFTRGDYRLS